MAEFKVGDRVRRIWTEDLATVVQVRPDNAPSSIEVEYDGHSDWKYFHLPAELELVEEFQEEDEPVEKVKGIFDNGPLGTLTNAGPVTFTLSTSPNPWDIEGSYSTDANMVTTHVPPVEGEEPFKVKYEPGSREIPFADTRLSYAQKKLAEDLLKEKPIERDLDTVQNAPITYGSPPVYRRNPEWDFEEEVQEIFDANRDLLLRKHADYGPKNISQSPGGALNGLRVRVWDKIARINNLIESGAEPQNESLRDSWVDLLNYSAIAIMVLDGTWPDE